MYLYIIIIIELILLFLLVSTIRTKVEHFDNNIPVDLVYTWVDGDDPIWNEKRNFYSGNTKLNFDSNVEVRYKNIDELKYSLRSVEKYAPWINKIYIVVFDGQVPSFLNIDNPKIQVINHSEIFKNENHLPTFNSHAIEANLQNIPGLSEYFLYFNDDCFFGNTILKKDLISPLGKPYYYKEKWACNYKGDTKVTDKAFVSAWKNNNFLLNKEFKNRIPSCPWHQGVLCKKSIIKRLEKKYKPIYEKTSASKFRSIDNIAPIGLSCTYGKESNEYINRPPITNIYFSAARANFEKLQLKLFQIKIKKPKFFCINNIEQNHSNINDIIHFFEEYFPEKSSFEK